MDFCLCSNNLPYAHIRQILIGLHLAPLILGQVRHLHKALFGSYPSLESAQELYSNNVKVFVDLTTDDEKTTLHDYYNSINDITYLNYPIEDRKIPVNIATFSSFVVKILEILVPTLISPSKTNIPSCSSERPSSFSEQIIPKLS